MARLRNKTQLKLYRIYAALERKHENTTHGRPARDEDREHPSTPFKLLRFLLRDAGLCLQLAFGTAAVAAAAAATPAHGVAGDGPVEGEAGAEPPDSQRRSPNPPQRLLPSVRLLLRDVHHRVCMDAFFAKGACRFGFQTGNYPGRGRGMDMREYRRAYM